MSRLVDGVDGAFAGVFELVEAAAEVISASPRPAPARCRTKSGSARAILAPAAGSRKLSVPTATSVAPDVEQLARVAALCTPPMPTTGIATRAATAATCASATARIAGPDSPPVPPPSHGAALAGAPGRERHRAQRVDQRDGVGAARLGGPRAGGHVGGVGRELDDQRLARARAHRAHDRLELQRVGADVEAGLDVRAGHVQLDRRDLRARARRPRTSARELLGARAHDVRDQRHGRAARLAGAAMLASSGRSSLR